MALSLLFLTQFNIPYSILFVQVTFSHFSIFKIIVGMSLPCFLLINIFCAKKTNKKRVLIANLHCIDYVCHLSVSYRMSVRTSQKMHGVQC